jgi:DNA-binding NtrC family response regulator
MEDIPLLAENFIARFNALQKKDIAGASDSAMAVLMAYTYPGNIRELANIIERAFILCKTGFIEKKHLPESIFTVSDVSAGKDAMPLKDMESTYLINALKQNNWNRLQTAKQLNMHKSTLYRKIKSLGLSLPQ